MYFLDNAIGTPSIDACNVRYKRPEVFRHGLLSLPKYATHMALHGHFVLLSYTHATMIRDFRIVTTWNGRALVLSGIQGTQGLALVGLWYCDFTLSLALTRYFLN